MTLSLNADIGQKNRRTIQSTLGKHRKHRGGYLMGLSINPFYQSASVPANTTTGSQTNAIDTLFENQNEVRFGKDRVSVVFDPKGQVVSTFNA